jgi:hypothetical protein
MALVLATLGVTGSAGARSGAAQNAEATFFRALNDDVAQRKAALRELQTAVAVDPADARSAVLLGLCHLWIAADGTRANPAEIEHVILAEHYLARAERLDPSDRRIPSWLVPARLARLSIEGERSQQGAVYATLVEEFENDPAFHSFTLALLNFDEPRGSERFASGLAALRRVPECADDPSCQNRARWPHNIEAFLMFKADYEAKAGNAVEARAALEAAKATPGFATWRHAAELHDRLANLDDYVARYASGDRGDDPPRPQVKCTACHGK